MQDRENIVKRFDEYYHNFKAHCIGDIEDHAMLKDVFELLKEQKGLMLALEQSNAVNGYLNAEVERLNGLLKEQEEKPVGKEWGECPRCGRVLNQLCNMHFCGTCGQAVKWE